jgi:nitrogenase subunit NifH
MSNEAQATEVDVKRMLLWVGPANVTQVYSGKPGCGCGCRGAYTDAKAQKTRVLNLMRQRADEVRFDDGVLVLEDEKHYRWAYLAEGWESLAGVAR